MERLGFAIVLLLLGVGVVVASIARYSKTKDKRFLLILGVFLAGLLAGAVVFGIIFLRPT